MSEKADRERSIPTGKQLSRLGLWVRKLGYVVGYEYQSCQPPASYRPGPVRSMRTTTRGEGTDSQPHTERKRKRERATDRERPQLNLAAAKAEICLGPNLTSPQIEVKGRASCCPH